MATLEKINYAEDTGTQAIQKLDRNQRKINDDVKIIDMDGVKQQLTNLASNDTAQQQQLTNLASNDTTQQQQINALGGKFTNFTDIPTFSGGTSETEGGEVHFSIPTTSTKLTSIVTMDVCVNNIRFFTTCEGILKIVSIDFSNVKAGETHIATTEAILVDNISFLNGFSRYQDISFGIIARSGNIVHINFLLANNGAGSQGRFTKILTLPFIPIRNEIHMIGNFDSRTHTDGSFGIIGQLPNDGGFTPVDITYVCGGQ